MTLEEKIGVLKVTSAFRDLADDTLRQVLEGSHSRSVKRGEHLFLEGEEVASIYVLASGVARTFYLNKQAREFTVELHSTRAVLGIQALFSTRQGLRDERRDARDR